MHVQRAGLSSRLLLFVSLWVFIGLPLLVHAADALPSADEVMKRAVERAKWVEEQNIEATHAYTRLSVTEQLDDNEAVKEHEELLYHVYPVEGLPFAELIQKNGSTPTPPDLKKERERQKKIRERLAQRRQHRDDEDVTLDEELVSKYRFQMMAREAVNGRAAFVLGFEPRSDDLPVRRRVDRFLNKLVGTLWVDEHDYDISKVVFHLKENVAVGWGILASFRKFDVSFLQTRASSGVWFPSRIDAYIDGRVLFKSFHVRQREQMSDFRTVTSETGKGTPATK
jgi:hypothetical protein